MQNREPTYPGRVTLTPVAGLANTYDMDRADQPLQLGTPLNKATLLKDATAALYGMGTGAVPDDVLALLGKYKQYWWYRISVDVGWYQVNTTATNRLLKDDLHDTVVYTYGDSISVSKTDGTITINSASSMTLRRSTVTVDKLAVLKGKYFKTDVNQGGHIIAGDIYFVPTDATITRYYDDESGAAVFYTSELTHVTVEYRSTIGDWEYLQSFDRNAYPDSGIQNGFAYKYLDIPFNNAVNAPKLIAGNYIGTGKYDSAMPNTLTFPYVPQFLAVGGAKNFHFWAITGDDAAEATRGANNQVWVTLSWNDKTVSWYNSVSAEFQLNLAGRAYNYIAFC